MGLLEDLAAPHELDGRAFQADPYPRYRQLRSAGPLHAHPSIPGGHLLTRYADCEAVLRDARWSSDAAHLDGADTTINARSMLAAAGVKIMLFTDPPDHTRLRRLVSKAFTPRAVESYRPRIQAIVDELLDEAHERGEMDVIGDFGFVVPVRIICEMLGVPAEDRDKFRPWSADTTRLIDGNLDEATTTRAMASALQVIDYLGDLIADHRAHPRDDLLSAMIAAEEEGDRLTEEELRLNALLLFMAGHETTTNLIGNGTKALLEHPDERRRWHDDPGLTPSAVEELLRWDSPVQLTARFATTDLELVDRPVVRGTPAIVLLAAANRDPDRFTDPERLDLGRREGPPLTFSLGMHHCLGAALARMEGQVALGTMVARFPDLELRTDALEYREHEILRGLRALPVAVG